MQTPDTAMTPQPGTRLQRFVGDSVRFRIEDRRRADGAGWKGVLRTNIGRAATLRRDIIRAHAAGAPFAGESWRDVPMIASDGGYEIELSLAEPGFFCAKAYLRDPRGWQHWPHGADVGLAVHPDVCRSANLIYCAFTRMFGASRALVSSSTTQEIQLGSYDALGYTVIPPSGKLRELKALLPHIFNTLGCRILQLLPVHPTPTTYARFGRFGSPYAALDLTAIDPALVDFDKRTTGVDQFRELTYEAHLLGGRVFLDIVINHTGWGSVLQENHPEWFLRKPDGSFASPGAWGNTWEDLVELRHQNVALWDELSEMFLTWCRRGVDGFRCDAGYKVPVEAWRYIIARVQEEYPETIFLLEGLGGAWEATEALLTEGGMQWAYSELFQNYSPGEIHSYLRHSLHQSERVGLLVHYSETHDNDRLARKGRTWSLLRNRLCALVSKAGGFGFTCGVEWLATEKLKVHGSSGMNWGAADNLVPELQKLNQLLAEHPCFLDGAATEVLTQPDSPVLALRRRAAESNDELLVIINTVCERTHTLATNVLGNSQLPIGKWVDLLGQRPPVISSSGAKDSLVLDPGAAYCLAPSEHVNGLNGSEYRRLRALAAMATEALGHVVPGEQLRLPHWRELASMVDACPSSFLAGVAFISSRRATGEAAITGPKQIAEAFETHRAGRGFPRVIEWSLIDTRRVTVVPPGHWVLVRDTARFRCSVTFSDGSTAIHRSSAAAGSHHVVFLAPRHQGAKAELTLERYDIAEPSGVGELLFLSEANTEPQSPKPLPKPTDIALLTNGRGAMARLCVDLGQVRSKYDCVLGANLHPELPVDRHVLVKRIRAWLSADGFITPLDFARLRAFSLTENASWDFVANAGDGRTVEVRVTAAMWPEKNSISFQFTRPSARAATGKQLPASADVRLIVRLDLEDRNFHHETKHNAASDYHFNAHTRPLPAPQIGFAFAPAPDRQLFAISDSGQYHPQPEWSHNIPHPVEQTRGQEPAGDAFSPGWFEIPLPKNASAALTVTAENDQNTTPPSAPPHFHRTPTPPDARIEAPLEAACRAFVVKRNELKTVIAGYPWFLDWGRDTLICARGLLSAGMVEDVKQMLIAFAKFEERGTLPNTIHGEDASNRDTVDAPLWFGVVLEELAACLGQEMYHTRVRSDGRTLLDTLKSIGENYLKGTPNGIHADPATSLVWSPAHFTWMDTNYPACTPREGYPIEIQSLWIRLLRHLSAVTPESERWHALACRALESLDSLFWLPNQEWYSDALLAKRGQKAANATPDDALRSNCLLPISLGLLKGERTRKTVLAAARYLVVPGALRTLAPLSIKVPLPLRSASGTPLNDPHMPYWGMYEGDEDTRRKPAYHNGSAWTWTFPSFCEALAAAWDHAPEAVQAARAYLSTCELLLTTGCLGHLPELVDGDAPHHQRGCDAQAWSVTEALRVWKLLKAPGAEPSR